MNTFSRCGATDAEIITRKLDVGVERSLKSGDVLIIVTTAFTLHRHGITNIENVPANSRGAAAARWTQVFSTLYCWRDRHRLTIDPQGEEQNDDCVVMAAPAGALSAARRRIKSSPCR